MFWSKEKYGWHYSIAGIADPNKGPENIGANAFNNGRYLNVVRETAQNGADAKNQSLGEDLPVKMVYEHISIDREDIPDIEDLEDTINKGYKYLKSLPNIKLDEIEYLKHASDKHYSAKNKRISALKVSDYNTVGLAGDRAEKLLRMEGLTNKGAEDTAGDFGLGKEAASLLSSTNTILYSSFTIENKYLFQGKTHFSSFLDNDGKRRNGKGMFGFVVSNKDQDELSPAVDIDDVPLTFRRNEPGTDIYIVGFDAELDWIDQMAICALENFFYAIYSNKLEFVFKDNDKEVIITKKNLDEQIGYYNDLYEKNYKEKSNCPIRNFSAPKYWNVLMDSRAITEKCDDFLGKGQIILHLLLGDNVEGKSVLEMRRQGMRIQEDTIFPQLPPFNAILVATGNGKENEDFNNNISKFLMKLENPAHKSWAIDNLRIPEIKEEAEKVLKKLHKFIRDTVKKYTPKTEGETIDAFDLNYFLPDLDSEDSEECFEEAAIYSLIPRHTVSEDISENDKKNKFISLSKEKNTTKKKSKQRNPPHVPLNKRKKKNVLKEISLKSVSTPYDNTKGCYRVSLVSTVDASPLFLKLNISGDDSLSFDAKILEAKHNNEILPIKEDIILLPSIGRNKKEILEIKLSENGIYALEVFAYVEN